MKSEKEAASTEIAIIGMAGRFPAAQDVDSLWKAISERRDCVADFPGGRTRELDHFYTLAGTSEGPPTRRGGFLSDFDRFDAAFFHLAPRDAEWMDPQQRLLLEVAWESLENAGQTQETLKGSKIGVFVGIWNNDYEFHANLNAPAIDFFSLTGGSLHGAASRLAHQFDFRGPDITVNASSAASLIAVHLAVRSLRSGETSMALAAGVNMIFRDERSRAFSRAGMLAQDGCCKFGAAGTDGIVRSEGAGVLILKRLPDALRDGDSLLGLIIGTAVTNSGKAGGSLTTPSESAQRATMLDALADAGVEPASVQYVEAHGTGSRAGDPVELAAIASVFGGSKRLSTCRVGSVKSNIGHTESAAGVAGIIKTVQALRHKAFPPTLYADRPNPAIDWASAGIVLEGKGTPWNATDSSPRRAAVNGLALMGTNAHVVLEEAPGTARVELPARTCYLLPISAASDVALRQRVQDMLGILRPLEERDGILLADICYTAAVRRNHLYHRVVVAGRNPKEICDGLQDYLNGKTSTFLPTVQKSFMMSGREGSSVESTEGVAAETEISLSVLSNRYVSGSTVNWRQLYPFGNLVGLPAYPWQRERFWIGERLTESAPSERAITSSLKSDDRFEQRDMTKCPRDVDVVLTGKLKSVDARHRSETLTSWLRDQVAVVLQSTVEKVATDKALKLQGLDSLMSMELLGKIERGLGISLSTGTLWNYSEIATLARYLSERLLQDEEARRQTNGRNVAASEPSRTNEASAAELLEQELAGAEMVLRRQVL